MSIAITAPRKFDLQDLVCLELMLRFYSFKDAICHLEPFGREDGEILWGGNPAQAHLEIQVKGDSVAITLDHIGSWLAHTPPRDGGNTLLERLISDPRRFAVFVVSGRCDDATSIYLVRPDWSAVAHKAGTIHKADTEPLLRSFVEAIYAPSGSSDARKAERATHRQAFAEAVSARTLRDALHRVVIWEQVDHDRAEQQCAEHLRLRHRVPDDRTTDVILWLHRALKAAKQSKTDAFPAVRSALDEMAPNSIRPRGYVLRGDEVEHTKELSQHGVLLLSGAPRIGKTSLARWIAADFENQGYEIRESDDAEWVERFLMEPDSGPRLVVLDDPLGGVRQTRDPFRQLGIIEALLPRLPHNRKLIVVQAQQYLLETTRRLTLDRVNTAGCGWHDLSLSSVAFLERAWISFSQTFAVDEPLRNVIGAGLQSGTLRIDVGPLRHLAAEHGRLHGSTDLTQALRLANEDAMSVGCALANDGFQPMLMAMAIATGAGEPIAIRELAFVLGHGKPTDLSLVENDMDWLCGGSDDERVPRYAVSPELEEQEDERLEMLERRGIIVVTARRASFVHSFYGSAAQGLLDQPTERVAKKITAAVERGLFCLAPATSRATARNLDWIFDNLAGRGDSRALLFQYAVKGLRSRFLATRDLCFRFLVQRLANLPETEQGQISQWVEAVAAVSFHSLSWIDGEAWIRPSRVSNLMDYFGPRVPPEKVSGELPDLPEASGQRRSPQWAVGVLDSCKGAPWGIRREVMERLLSYDEALIRSEAVELWLQGSRSNDDELLRRIFSEDHPSIALAALKGTIQGWHAWTSERRERVLQGLVRLATSPANAATLLERLVLFGRVEYTGENTPWQIFETLAPPVMRALPQNSNHNAPRLYGVMQHAVKVISSPSMLVIWDRWVDFLERKIQAGRLPDEYELGVVPILIDCTLRQPLRREQRIARLLALPGTGPVMVFVADLVDRWSDLTEEERVGLGNVLAAPRSDARWLKAAAITGSQVPRSVQEQIFGNTLTLDDSAETLLNQIEPILLSTAVQVFVGHPSPLWNLGTHHRGKLTWRAVITQIGLMPLHPLFELAWREVAVCCTDEQLATLVRSVGASRQEEVFELLLRIRIGCTNDWKPEAWSALFALAADSEARRRWVQRLAEYIPVIVDRLGDLWYWLKDSENLNLMLEALQSDTALILIVKHFSELESLRQSEEHRAKLVKALKVAFQTEPPRILDTCDEIRSALKKMSIQDEELLAFIEERRSGILKQIDVIRGQCRFDDPPLIDWTYVESLVH